MHLDYYYYYYYYYYLMSYITIAIYIYIYIYIIQYALGLQTICEFSENNSFVAEKAKRVFQNSAFPLLLLGFCMFSGNNFYLFLGIHIQHPMKIFITDNKMQIMEISCCFPVAAFFFPPQLFHEFERPVE